MKQEPLELRSCAGASQVKHALDPVARLQRFSYSHLPEQSAGNVCADACVQAVMSFDLGCPVGDAQWAPYSATVFAAVGDDGRVQVSVALQMSCLPFKSV